MNTLQLNDNMNIINTDQWNIINEIKWYNNSKMYGKEANDMVAEYCISNLTYEEIIELHNFVVDKRKELSNFLMGYLTGISKERRKELTVSDDGFWDLCSHIVGMGEVVFNLVKTYPYMIFDLQREAQENFEYGFDKAVYEINMRKEND